MSSPACRPLETYDKARREHTTAKSALGAARADLQRTLTECADVFRQVNEGLAQACDAAAFRTATWVVEVDCPDTASLVTLLDTTASDLVTQIAAAQLEQNDQAPSKAGHRIRHAVGDSRGPRSRQAAA